MDLTKQEWSAVAITALDAAKSLIHMGGNADEIRILIFRAASAMGESEHANEQPY